MARNNAINIDIEAGGGNTYTFPASTDTLVGRATTDTLTNKTLTSPIINTYTSATADTTDLGSLGSTETVNFASSPEQYGDLDANITITISGITDGKVGYFYGRYDTAERTLAWSGVDYWQDGTPPTAGPSEVGYILCVFKGVGTDIIGSYGYYYA